MPPHVPGIKRERHAIVCIGEYLLWYLFICVFPLFYRGRDAQEDVVDDLHSRPRGHRRRAAPDLFRSALEPRGLQCAPFLADASDRNDRGATFSAIGRQWPHSPAWLVRLILWAEFSAEFSHGPISDIKILTSFVQDISSQPSSFPIPQSRELSSVSITSKNGISCNGNKCHGQRVRRCAEPVSQLATRH